METLTLLRSNLKHRKGPFISTALLVLIITAMTLSMLSVKENYINARDHAHEYNCSPDIMVFAQDSPETDKAVALLENCPSLDHFGITEAAFPDNIYFGEDKISRSIFLTAPSGKLLLLNGSMDGLEDEVPELKKGEIYLPYILSEAYNLSIGSRITAEAAGQIYDFTVKGFVSEPFMGSDSIGIKLMYISPEDVSEMIENSREHDSAIDSSIFSDINNGYINTRIIKLYSNDPDMTDSRFMREIELETKLISSSLSLTKDDSNRYTSLELNIIYAVVLAFTSILFLIVLIVIGHSIRVEIKIDYVNMGILKSIGITENKISLVIMLRYLIAETVGMTAGLICSIPIERKLSSMFMELTGIIPERSTAWGYGSLVLLVMISASALLIFLCTRDLSRISPVKAINGGQNDIHFDNMINAPITKRGLSMSLALRGITSAKKRYIGLTFITAVLTFFMVAVNTVNSTMNSRSALESVINYAPDIMLSPNSAEDIQRLSEAEDIIMSYTDIENKLYLTTTYVSVDGNNICCVFLEQPENYNGLLKGRWPEYENELIITKMAADAFGLKMGDTVTVNHGSYSADYLITGLYQSTVDAGISCMMPSEAGKKLNIKDSHLFSYYVKDTKKGREAVNEINKRLSSSFDSSFIEYGRNSLTDDYDKVTLTIEAIILIFSILFVLITMMMICSRTFLQERHDIGVYKAMGFTNGRLRIQFAVRFFFVSVIGGLLGIILSFLCTASLLNFMYSIIGVVKIEPVFTADSFIVAILFISSAVMVFAYLISGKIKKVSARELITE